VHQLLVAVCASEQATALRLHLLAVLRLWLAAVASVLVVL
jgi:hypothetical protein